MQAGAADAGLPGDRGGGQPVVAGDDVHTQTGPVAAADRVGYFWSERVGEGDEPEQAQVLFGLPPVVGGRFRRQVAPGDGEYPQAVLGVPGQHGAQLDPPLGGRAGRCRGRWRAGSTGEDFLGGAFDV